MSRQRFIYPDLFESEKFACLSLGARVLFVGMFTTADDYGRGRAGARALRSTIFPFDDIEPEAIDQWVDEILSLKPRAKDDKPWLALYEVEGTVYYQLPGWTNKQTPRWKSKSLIPDPRIGNIVDRRLFSAATGGPPAFRRWSAGETPANHRRNAGGPAAEEERGSRGVVEKRRGVVEGRGGEAEVTPESEASAPAARQPATEPDDGPSPSGAPEDSQPADPQTEQQLPEPAEAYDTTSLRRMLSKGPKGMEPKLGPGETKRRLRETDRPPAPPATPSPELQATQAWRHVVHALRSYDNPAAEVLDARITAAVKAAGGWEYLEMVRGEPAEVEAQRKFLEAYAGSTEHARAAT